MDCLGKAQQKEKAENGEKAEVEVMEAFISDKACAAMQENWKTKKRIGEWTRGPELTRSWAQIQQEDV